jgi:L-lactate dehydrogenase complex protein LldG
VERDRFLARVTSELAFATLGDPPDIDPGPLVPDLGEVDLVATFAENLVRIGGAVHLDEDPAEVVRRLAAEHGARDCLAWDGRYLPELGERLIEILPMRPHSVGLDDRLAIQSSHADLILGVTGAEAGFAESGTVVLRSGPGRPRMASLIPLVHVAILERSAIFRSLSHWGAERAGSMAEVANVVFITGPSRTADIEQIITMGVHGPKHLHVVLV